MKTKKWLSLFLSLVMLLGLLPALGGEARAAGVKEVSTWDGLDSALQAGGSVRLTADVSGPSGLTDFLNGTVTLDLNGHSVTGTAGRPVLTVCGELTLCDSAGGGRITGGNADEGGGVYVAGGGEFTMTGGSISGNRCSGDYGGGVYVNGGGEFTMTGGSIRGNSADYGGGVYVNGGGEFTMTGGSIRGNNAERSGGGVYLYSGCTFQVSGSPVIKDNVRNGTLDSASGMYTGGTADDVELNSTVIGVTGALTGAIICVNANSTAAFAAGSGHTLSAADAMCFLSSDGSRFGELFSNAVKLSGMVQSGYDWNSLYIALQQGGYIRLTGDATYYAGDPPLFVPSGKTVVLDLNNKTVNRNAGNYPDREGYVIKVAGLENDKSCLTVVDGSAEGGGVLTGGNNSIGGGGVFVDVGTFIMSGGSIVGNQAQKGGGVYVDHGAFTMSGGSIVGNQAISGGGVYVENGSFIMSGGSISGNKCSAEGGGVNVNMYSSFTMEGGSIRENAAENIGGVFVGIGSSFTMSGGSICENTANSDAGGVYMAAGAFQVSGSPVIRGNVLGGTITADGLSGGTANNAAFGSGTAISVVRTLTSDAYLGVSGVPGQTVAESGNNYYLTDSGFAAFHADDTTMHLVMEGNTIRLKKALTEDMVTMPASLIYTGEALNPVTVKDGNTTLKADTHYTVAYKLGDENASEMINAGTYTVVITGKSDAGYDDSVEKEFVIAPKELTITVNTGQSKVYGSEDPELTYTSEGLVNNDTISGMLERAPGEDVGTYAIGGTLSAGKNYTISFTGANFEITPKKLTVTAENAAITYGEAPANGGVKYSKFAYNDDASKLSGTLDYDYSYVQYGDVGSYTITPKGLTSNNYTITFVPGTLTVQQKEVGLIWDETALTYNGRDQYPAAEATGLVNGDAVSVTVECADASGEAMTAGDHTAKATELTGDKAGNYKLPEKNTYAYSIGKAALTVTADSAAKTYDGEALTSSGYTAEGLVTGDSITSLTVAGSQTEVGESDNVPSGAEIKNADGLDVTANYEISYVCGTLAVTAKPVYAVTFLDADGTVLKTVDTVEGETPDYGGTPAKAADAEYTYTFAGWTPAPVPAAGDATYTATYDSTLNKYTVSFLDEDGTELASAEYPYGTGAAEIALPDEPTKAEDEDYTYAFSGWSPALADVTKDAAYTATFTATAREKAPETCKITVKAAQGGSAFGGGVYTVGDDVVVTALAEEGWEFTGWTEGEKTVSTAAEYKFTAAADRTLTANFRQKTFTVTFLDEDGTELQSGEWAYGETPEYKGKTPAKAEDENYTYEFAGWDEELVPVTGKATYTATYKATEKPTEPKPEPTPEPEPEPTPKPKPSGGRDRVRTYRVTVVETEHGEVTVSPKAPEEGDRVKITAVPDEGYEVDSVTVTDDEGEKVKVKENSDGTWTYTQPRGNTTVKVTFKKTAEPEFPFEDVTEDMDCYEDVYWVWQRGIMIGMSDTEFGPELSLSRDMTVTVLYRLEGEPEVEYKGVFSDVPDGKWYTAPVEWAAASGIVLGYGDGTYGRTDDVTREQLAVILYRYAVMKGYAVETAALEAPDGDAVSDWAAEAVRWAAANGILAAGEDGTVRPGEAATRAEIAKAIRAFLEKVAE